MTVFVVNRVSDNISAAEKFGGLKFINERYVYGDELEPCKEFLTEWTMPMVVDASMTVAAAEFEPDFDYLLIAGDHLQLVFFVSLLTQAYGTFRVLRYDRKLGEYIPVRLDFRLAQGTQPVFISPPNIGDTSGQDSDKKDLTYDPEIRRRAEALALDGPHRPRRDRK